MPQRKNKIKLLITALLLIFLSVQATAQTQTISTCEELQNIKPDQHYILTGNIDCENKEITLLSQEKPFLGSIDGQGYAIRNTRIHAEGYSGLIALNKGILINIRLENTEITGQTENGIAGKNEGHIVNSHIQGIINNERINEYIGLNNPRPEKETRTTASSSEYETWKLETTLPGDYYNGVNMPLLEYAEGKIYLIGGRTNQETRHTWIYNTETRGWTQGADILVPVTGIGIAHYEGKIYVAGKFDDKPLQIYDIATNTWSFGTDMPEGRYDFGMAAMNGKLYVIGGGDTTTYDSTNTTFIYDIETDTWSQGTDMPTYRQGFYGVGGIVTGIGGKIYVAGGSDLNWEFPRTLDIYDPETDTWSKGADMPVGVAYHGATQAGGHLFIIGGLDEDLDAMNNVLRYTPQNDSWNYIENFPFPVSELGVAGSNNALYVAGGLNEDRKQMNKMYKYELPPKPALKIISPYNTTYPESTILVNITPSNESSNITFNWNGTNITYKEPVNITFSEGTNTLYAWERGEKNLSANVTFTVLTTPPKIYNHSIQPYAAINNTNITISVNVSTQSTIYANITLGNNTEQIELINGENNYEAESTGLYNITIYAEDIFSRKSNISEDYFEVFPARKINMSVKGFNFTIIDSKIRLYYRSQKQHTIIGNDTFSIIIPDTPLDTHIEAHNETLQTYLQSMLLEDNTTIIIDKHNEENKITYWASITNSFENATIKIYYSELGVSEPYNDLLVFQRCENYSFYNKSCNSAWEEITNKTYHDKEHLYFEYNTSSLSAFSIKKIEETEEPPQPTPPRRSSPPAMCTTEWECTEWTECDNGMQTRTCTEIIPGCNAGPKPDETRACETETEEAEENNTSPGIERPEQLFDIRLELANRVITETSQLVAMARFESFGTVPTPVNITYAIFDSEENEVHSEETSIVVETERILTRSFGHVRLTEGDYTFIMTTVYSDNIRDDFRQEFTVVEEEQTTTSTALIASYIVFFILVGAAAYFLVASIRQKRFRIGKIRPYKYFKENVYTVLGVFGIILLTFLFFGLMAEQKKAYEEKYALMSMQMIAREKAHQADTYMEFQKEKLRILASMNHFQEAALNPDDEDKIGRAKQLITRIGETYPGIGLFTEEGIIIAAENNPSRQDYGHLAYFTQEGHEVMFERYYDIARRQDYYAILGPVYHPENESKVIGGIGFDIDFHELSEIIRTDIECDISEAYLIDETKVLLSSSKYSEEELRSRAFVQEVRTEQADLCVEHIQEYRENGEAERIDEQVIKYINYRGEKVIGVHAHVFSIDGCVIVEKGVCHLESPGMTGLVTSLFR